MKREQFLAEVAAVAEKVRAEHIRICSYRESKYAAADRVRDEFAEARWRLVHSVAEAVVRIHNHSRPGRRSNINVNSKVELSVVRDHFNGTLDDRLKDPGDTDPSLEHLRTLRLESRRLGGEAGNLLKLELDLQSTLRILEKITVIYSRNERIEPAGELVTAISSAMKAPVNEVDDTGTPIAHRNLLPDIRITEYAYVAPA